MTLRAMDLPWLTGRGAPALVVASLALVGCAVDTTGLNPEAPDAFVLPEAGTDAGVDGGPLDGGPVDGGPVDGGPVDGGPVDGGPVDGGPLDGGPGDGGPGDGGPVDGGFDAGVDSGFDGGFDAGFDAGVGCEVGSLEVDRMCGLRVWVDGSRLGVASGTILPTITNFAPDHMMTMPAGDLVAGAGHRPALREDGMGQFIEFTDDCALTENPISEAGHGHFEIFAVMRMREVSGLQQFVAASSRFKVLFQNTTWHLDLPLFDPRWSGAGGFDEMAEWPSNTVTLVNIISGATAQLWIDGRVLSMPMSPRDTDNPTVPLAIGARNDSSCSQAASLDLYELLIFDEPLTGTQRNSIRSDLDARWSLGLGL